MEMRGLNKKGDIFLKVTTTKLMKGDFLKKGEKYCFSGDSENYFTVDKKQPVLFDNQYELLKIEKIVDVKKWNLEVSCE